jgi:hypothetical protein
MNGRIFGAALSALMLLATILPGHSEPPARTVAKEQTFYEALTFGPGLQGGALTAMLDSLSGEQKFAARLFRAIPGCVGNQTADLQDTRLTVDLSKRSENGPEKVYYQMNGIGREFAPEMRADGDHINAKWYHCEEILLHTLHATSDQKHFLIKVDGHPMLAWSMAGN